MNDADTCLLVLGAKTESRPDSAQYMPEFKAPKSYGAEAAAKWLTAAADDWRDNAKNEVYTGSVVSLAAYWFVPGADEPLAIHVMDSRKIGELPSLHLAKFLQAAQFTEWSPKEIVGRNIRSVVKLLAMEAAEVPGSIGLPREFWFGPDAGYYDIENIVTPSKSSTFTQALARLAPDLLELPLGHRPELLDVAVTCRLLARLQLYPQYKSKLLQLSTELAESLRAPLPARPAASLPPPVGERTRPRPVAPRGS